MLEEFEDRKPVKQSFREGKSEMSSMMYDYSTAPRIHFSLMIINLKGEHLACLFFFSPDSLGADEWKRG